MDKKRVSDKEIKNFSLKIKLLKKEMSKVIMGQDEIIDGLIMGIICNGHVLLEGVPGVAKTLIIKALGQVSGCSVKRIQFTVDLLPTDITGITTYTPNKGFEVIKGPIFSNFVIADEINRSPPKTQSALMQAMQEKEVTIGKKNFLLPEPFFVMATKNPLESAGVYPLPEAQVDRFLFKLNIGYPKISDEIKIMENNTTLKDFDSFNLKPVISNKDILDIQNSVRNVYMGDNIKYYILNIVNKTRDPKFEFSEYISYGASPRGTIALFIASKARALMNGRDFVIPEDVKNVIYYTLSHRLILSYKATIKGIDSNYILKKIIESVEIP